MSGVFTARSVAAMAALAAFPAAASATPVQWTANGHWYEFVTTQLDVFDAGAAAAAASHLGLPGYLATITSADEQGFLDQLYTDQGVRGAIWLGGSDAAEEGIWRWVAGPESGQVFYKAGPPAQSIGFNHWGPAEPNNSGPENYLQAWHFGTWNDANGDNRYGYLVEYSAVGTSVPLPASGLLLAAALGALVARRRRVPG